MKGKTTNIKRKSFGRFILENPVYSFIYEIETRRT